MPPRRATGRALAASRALILAFVWAAVSAAAGLPPSRAPAVVEGDTAKLPLIDVLVSPMRPSGSVTRRPTAYWPSSV